MQWRVSNLALARFLAACQQPCFSTAALYRAYAATAVRALYSPFRLMVSAARCREAGQRGGILPDEIRRRRSGFPGLLPCRRLLRRARRSPRGYSRGRTRPSRQAARQRKREENNNSSSSRTACSSKYNGSFRCQVYMCRNETCVTCKELDSPRKREKETQENEKSSKECSRQ